MSDSNLCSDSDYLSSLLALAEQSGLDAVGVASAEPFADARAALEKRRSRGLASSMQFTYRNPRRSCDPSATLPEAKSLIVGALRYEEDSEESLSELSQARSAHADSEKSENGGAAGRREIARERMFVRIASYARRDYYGDLRGALEAIAKRLQDDGHEARVVVDDNALMDREAARRAGLGWYGKNTCLLIPKKGSRFVLGSVITTAAFAPSTPIERTCGTCSLCQQACPTGALDIAGQLDARRCLAWLLQAEGIFPREHRPALGNRFYGCDDCQDVCPVNSLGQSSPGQSLGSLPSKQMQRSSQELQALSATDILSATDEELMSRYGRFYIPRRQPRYLRRNALLVLANTAAGVDEPDVESALQHAIKHEDPMLRAHGVWAAQRLGRFDLAENAQCDPDARVREEARRPAPLADCHAAPLADCHAAPLANCHARPEMHA